MGGLSESTNSTQPAQTATPATPAPSAGTSTEPIQARKRRRRRHRHRKGRHGSAATTPNQVVTHPAPSATTPPPASNPTVNGHLPDDDAPRLLEIDPEEIRQRVGEEVVLFRRRTAGPSRFVLRECFE